MYNRSAKCLRREEKDKRRGERRERVEVNLHKVKRFRSENSKNRQRIREMNIEIKGDSTLFFIRERSKDMKDVENEWEEAGRRGGEGGVTKIYSLQVYYSDINYNVLGN